MGVLSHNHVFSRSGRRHLRHCAPHNWRPLRSSYRRTNGDLGARLVFGLTSAGRVSSEMPVPGLVSVTGAVRDEGTSYHYSPPAARVDAPSTVSRLLESELEKLSLPVRIWNCMDYRRPISRNIGAVSAPCQRRSSSSGDASGIPFCILHGTSDSSRRCGARHKQC